MVKATLFVALSSCMGQLANAQLDGGFVGDYDDYGQAYNPSYANSVTVQVNRVYYGFSGIDLNRLFLRAAGGREIRSITVRMSAENTRSQATLLVNGAPSSRPLNVSTYLSEHYFSAQGGRGRVGRQNLELRLNGQVFIQSITAELSSGRPQPRPPYPGPSIITEHLYRNFYGENTLSVESLLNLYRYQGRTVNRVILRTRALNGMGRAALWANGRQEGSPIAVGSYTQEYSFFLNGSKRIGYDLRDLEIFLRGEFVVESVSVELSNY